MIAWVKYIVERSIEYVNVVEESKTIVGKSKAYISNNIDQSIKCEDIAGIVLLNPDYISRIFKRKTSLTITKYIARERIKIAQELLTNTEMKVSTIAEKLGYTNFSYFAKTFKKHTKINPYDYKQKMNQK